jgi:hypothetical protein
MSKIIAFFAKSDWGAVLLIPFVIWCGFTSWGSYLNGTSNTQDANRVRRWWGWLSPAMGPEWNRLADPAHPDYGSWYHSTKNIGSEWARLDVQRAYKAMSFLLVTLVALALIIGLLLGWWLL